MDQDPPRAVARDPIAHDGVVAAARDLEAGAHRGEAGDPGAGNVGVVVVVDVVVPDDRARVGSGRADGAAGAGSVLGGRGVVIVERVVGGSRHAGGALR